MRTYKDSFGNIATIEEVKIYPYKGASRKETAYRLTCKSEYNENFIYHVSVYETFKKAYFELTGMSAATFEEIKEGENT